MITSLNIQNFQAHRSLQLQLDPITTITGATDSGKSSIVRALRWLLLNDVSGDFITHGEVNCKVEAEVDGHVVTRKKGKSTNYYSIDAADPYDAIGRDVPRDVETLLNVTDNNIQGQLDAHFWLSETPGEVSKQLNAVVELGAIDDAVAAIASEIRTTQAKKKLLDERLESAKVKRQSLAWVRDANEEFGVVAERQAIADSLRQKYTALARAVTDVDSAASERDVAVNAAVAGREALAAASRVLDLGERINTINTAVLRYTAAQADAGWCGAAADDGRAVLAIYTKQEELRQRKTQVEGALFSVSSHRMEYKTLVKELEEKQETLASVATCPLCGRTKDD